MHSYDENALENATVINGHKNPQNSPLHGDMDHYLTRFLGPTALTIPNSISIGSPVFAWLMPHSLNMLSTHFPKKFAPINGELDPI